MTGFAEAETSVAEASSGFCTFYSIDKILMDKMLIQMNFNVKYKYFFILGGIYTFTLVDFYSATISLMCIALFETIAIVWCYGADRNHHIYTKVIKYKINYKILVAPPLAFRGRC